MDIVEVEGKPIAKRGKASGSKRVLRCPSCHVDRVVPAAERLKRCVCGGRYEEIIVPLIDRGKLRKKLPTPQQIRAAVLERVADVAL